MADLDTDLEPQDQAELFDEDNTNPQERGPGEEGEQVEDLVDVFDATARVGDADDDEAAIGEDLDDEDIVESARDSEQDDADLEDDDLVRADEAAFYPDEDVGDPDDLDDDPDVRDRIDARRSGEVELEYAGDLDDVADAEFAAQSLESAELSDRDLRELDYKDEYTVDDADADAPPR